MQNRQTFLTTVGATIALCVTRPLSLLAATMTTHDWRTLSDAQWRARLTPQQYDVMRQAGTETPFTSPLLNEHRRGRFACAACALALFDARTKYDSHTGWPSFYRALPHGIATRSDGSLPGEERTEVHCSRCESHLGHVFTDGPQPTGLRYCMNGVALQFQPA